MSLDSAIVIQQVERVTAFRDSGASIAVLSADDSISGSRCDALSTLEGVEGAGGIALARDPLRLPALPATSISLYEVTPGFVGVLGVQPVSEAGIYLSEELAAALSVTTGDLVPGLDVRVVGVFEYPKDGRLDSLRFAAVAPTNTAESFDECWANMTSTYEDDRQVVRGGLALTISNPDDVRLTQLNPSHGTEIRSTSLYFDRLSRWAPLLAGVSFLALATVAMRLRKLELASVLQVGQGRYRLALQLCLEAMAWFVPSAIVAGLGQAALSVLSTSSGIDLAGIIATGFAIVGSGLAGLIGGTLLGLSTIQTNRLFHYFKDRG